MSFEPSVTGIWSLDPTLPLFNSPVEYGDDNIRNIKAVLQWQFVGFAGDTAQVTVTPTQLNYLSGAAGNIQDQLDDKLESSDLTKAMIDALGVDAATLGSAASSAYALLASADFTALQVGGVDVATTDDLSDAGPAVGSWVDVQNPLTSVNSSATVAHGMAAKPDMLIFRLVCLSDDNGYTAGAELELGMMTSSDGAPCWEGDATNVTVRWRDLRLTATDGTSAPNPGTSSDWKLQAKGVKF